MYLWERVTTTVRGLEAAWEHFSFDPSYVLYLFLLRRSLNPIGVHDGKVLVNGWETSMQYVY